MMELSYVIITRNRRDTLLATLRQVERNTPLPRGAWEVFVIDNASDDGSADAVAQAFPTVNLIRLSENEGMPARNRALGSVRGRYVVFLDDDSYPIGDAVPRSIAHLDADEQTAALVARVVLPSNECEAPAMPSVTLGGASMVRTRVLDEVGGFPGEFFRQAEEYDFSFRVWRAGYRVERFEDVIFRHEKVAGGRSSALTRGMDLRNNLILVDRYLPEPIREEYRADWTARYTALAHQDGHHDAAEMALHDARQWAQREIDAGRPNVLDDASVESIFELDDQTRAVSQWAVRKRIQRVLLADFSKNLYASYAACKRVGLEIAAVTDDHPAYANMLYRGLEIMPDARVPRGNFDGVVLSSTNAATVDRRVEQLHQRFGLPVLRLWHPKYLGAGRMNAAA